MAEQDRTPGFEPPRKSVLGALVGLLVAENKGDILDEVFIICDALGIERPEETEPGIYYFSWEEQV